METPIWTIEGSPMWVRPICRVRSGIPLDYYSDEMPRKPRAMSRKDSDKKDDGDGKGSKTKSLKALISKSVAGLPAAFKCFHSSCSFVACGR